MLLAILENEEKIQVGDLTRFKASKSIAVKGSANPINAVKITAGASATEVNVFDSDSNNWFLDWAFNEQSFDIDSTNRQVLFKVGGVEYSTNIAVGTYATLALLLAQIKTVIEAVASPLTVTFSVGKYNRITITPSDASFSPVLNQDPASLFDQLQFVKDSLVSMPVEYSTKIIELEVSSISESATIKKYVKLYTPEGDKLFSSDADLTTRERDILKWTAEGRASFIAEHRAAQEEILEWLYDNNILDGDGNRLTKWSIVRTPELNLWSTYKVLANLMLSFSNAVDDDFDQKAAKYNKIEIGYQNKFNLKVDTDLDGEQDAVQETSTSSGSLVRS